MICSKCGKIIPDDAQKCPECGAEIIKEATENKINTESKETTRSAIEKKPLYKANGIDPQRPVRKLEDEKIEKEKRKRAPAIKALIWIAAVIIIAAAVIAAIHYIEKIGKSEDVPDVTNISEPGAETDAEPDADETRTMDGDTDEPLAQETDDPQPSVPEEKPEYDIHGTWRWESEADGYRDTYWVFSNNGNLEIYLTGFSYDYDWPKEYEYDKESCVLSLTGEAMGLAWLDENTFACGSGKAYRIDFSELPDNAVNVQDLEVEPAQDDIPKEDPYLLPKSNSAYLTKDDLADIEPDMLRFARNEIFARHGRLFSDESLQNYFNKQSWYSGYIKPVNFNSSVLNDYERYNAAFISKYEESLGY